MARPWPIPLPITVEKDDAGHLQPIGIMSVKSMANMRHVILSLVLTSLAGCEASREKTASQFETINIGGQAWTVVPFSDGRTGHVHRSLREKATTHGGAFVNDQQHLSPARLTLRCHSVLTDGDSNHRTYLGKSYERIYTIDVVSKEAISWTSEYKEIFKIDSVSDNEIVIHRFGTYSRGTGAEMVNRLTSDYSYSLFFSDNDWFVQSGKCTKIKLRDFPKQQF